MNQAEETLNSIRPATPQQPAAHVTLTMTPLKKGALKSGDMLDVLIEASASEAAPRKALPLNLAFVIDRSGSMSGQPLDEAKSCVKAMIRRMKPTDLAAVVVYDHRVDTIIPVMSVAELLPTLDHRLDPVSHRGNTDLHAGWLAGAEHAAPGSGPNALSRIILLSDGNANSGITSVAEIASQARKLADAAVSTSTYGLGRSFNEHLMTEIASHGNGAAYYGETATDLMPKFLAEFDALAATVGRDPRITTSPQAECLNGMRLHPAGGYLLPNLVAGAASWALLRFPLGSSNDVHKVAVTLAWTDDAGATQSLTETLEVPALDEPELEGIAKDGKVAERIKEVEAASIQKEAKAAADRRDWGKVEDAVLRLKSMAGDNAYITGVAETLEGLAALRDSELLAKEAMFASTSMTRGYASLHLSEQSMDVGAPSYARRSLRQGKNDDNKSA